MDIGLVYNKAMLKEFVRKRLENYVKLYFKKHPTVKLVVVTGSVGKTSTKRALGTLLHSNFRVRMEEKNFNTDMSVPLGVLGIQYPANIRSIFAWLSVFKAAKQRINSPTDVDIIIQELGSDSPGDVVTFGRYLKPDYAMVTGVTPEHMEFFKTLDAVAKEELSVSEYSGFTFINSDDVSSEYADFATNPNFTTYGVTEMAEYHLEAQGFDKDNGYTCKVYSPELAEPFEVQAKVLGEHSLRPVAGAIAVAIKLGLQPQQIQSGVSQLRAIPGRMNMIKGIGGTTIIDDTYNSSPAAAVAALRTMYELFANEPQRIAILGDMRELGDSSKAEHEALGAACDPSLLEWVVTVGPETEQYLAPVAKSRGCQVKSFMSSIEAAGFVSSVAQEGAVILAKGSQNNIFLEEAVINLCVMTEDVKVVRQSPEWLATKKKFFESLANK